MRYWLRPERRRIEISNRDKGIATTRSICTLLLFFFFFFGFFLGEPRFSSLYWSVVWSLTLIVSLSLPPLPFVFLFPLPIILPDIYVLENALEQAPRRA